MLRRTGLYIFSGGLLALVLAAGCNKNGDGPTGGNGGGPTNSPLSVTETYEQQVDEETQATWGLDASDDDGLKRVQFEIIYDPQTGQDSVLASIDQAVSNKTWSEQVQAALGPGSVNGTYTITSNNPAGSDDTKSGSFSTQILAPGDNAASINLNAPAQLTNGETFSVDIDANDADGIDSVYVHSSRGAQADTTIGLNLSGTNINQNIEIPYNRPNSALPEDFITSAELVDSDGNRYSSNEQTTTLEAAVNNATYTVSGNVINANSNQDVADANTALLQGTNTQASDQTSSQGQFSMDVSHQEGTSEDYDLTITKTGYKDYIQTIAVSSDQELTDLLLAPQDVLFTGLLNEETTEDQNALVTAQELSSNVDFQDAGRHTIYVQTSDPNLAISVNGQDFELDPADGFVGNAQYTVVAISSTAGRAEQNESLYVQDVPKADINVGNNETDQILDEMPVSGYMAHLGSYDLQGNRLDTLDRADGRFTDVNMNPDGDTIIRARFTQNGEPKSYLRRTIIDQGDTQETIYLIDWNLRDKAGNIVDQLVPGAEKAASPEGFAHWIRGTHGEGIQPWNNERFVEAITGGQVTYPVKSDGSKGLEAVLLPQVFYSINEDKTHYMHERTQQAYEDVYNNEYREWIQGLPAISYPDSISLDVTNNAYKHQGILMPITDPAQGEFGSIGAFGETPNRMLMTASRVRADRLDGVEDSDLNRYAGEEMFNIGAATTRPAGGTNATDEYTTHQQSISHNSSSLTAPSNYDGKYFRFVHEPTFRHIQDKVGDLDDFFTMPPLQ